MMVSLNKEIQYATNKGKEIYDERRAALELDSFNLLYVALTRAAEQLYIITEKKLLKSGLEDFNYYSGIGFAIFSSNMKRELGFGGQYILDLNKKLKESLETTFQKLGILKIVLESQKLWYSLFCSIGDKMNIPAMAIIVIENNITYPTFSFFIFYLVKDCE